MAANPVGSWFNMLTPKEVEEAPKGKRVYYKGTPRTSQQKEALGLRVCNQMYRQIPYPPEDETLERLQDETLMRLPEAKAFLKKYKADNHIGLQPA